MEINELAKNLLRKNASRLESIRLLRTLKSQIREGVNKMDIGEIKAIFNLILCQSNLAECPSLIVRLYLASCFSDALYIYAPSIPLTTTGELDAMFQLFSTVLSSHYDEGTTESDIVQNIVEVLNSTDSYLLIRNREVSCEIIESMIKIKPITDVDSDQNFSNAVEYIANLTNSITSQLLLQEILKLFATNFNTSPLAQAVLPLLNQSNQAEIVGCFQQYLNYSDFLKSFVKASKILNLSISFITQTLYEDLIHEDDSQRVSVFTLLGQLFKQYTDYISDLDTQDSSNSSQDSSKINLSTDSKCIKFILSRCVDKCPKIRLIILQIAHDLIENSNPLFLDDSLKVLKNISVDPNESIRLSGLDLIFDLIQNYISKNKKYPFHFNFHLSNFLNDKSFKIREKALLFSCELTHFFFEIKDRKNSIKHLDNIIHYCYENPGIEIFLAFSKLFEYFDSTDIYDLASNTFQLMKVLRYIKTTSDTMKKFIETSNLPSNNISKLFTKEIWKPFIFRTDLLSKNRVEVLKMTNDQFAKEFCALTMNLRISIEKLLNSSQKKKLKDFAFLNPYLFLPLIGEILDHCDEKCVCVLPLIPFDETDEVFERLLDSNSEEALIVFAKLFSRSNWYSKVKVLDHQGKLIFKFDEFVGEVYYTEFSSSFSLKFFYYLSIPELIPNSIFTEYKSKSSSDLSKTYHSDDVLEMESRSMVTFSEDTCSLPKNDLSIAKLSFRLSFFFNVRDLISIHFYFIENHPNSALKSLFRISNVIDDENANKFCVFRIKRPKKKTNILNFLSSSQLRSIASIYLNSMTTSAKYQFISLIDEALKNPKTPIEFLSLLVIVFGHASKKNNDIYSKCRSSLLFHLNLRRHFAPQNLNSKQKGESVVYQQQIELMIPSLFNLIAFLFNDYQSIIDKIFEFVFPKSNAGQIALIVNEIIKKLNRKSRFGQVMNSICNYSLSKLGTQKVTGKIDINLKFITDEGNLLQ